MLVDGFNDLHGFRASVPDDGEFDGVMGFAVPVFHVSVKECGAALLSLLAEMLRAGPPMLVRTKLAPLSSMSILNLGGIGGL